MIQRSGSIACYQQISEIIGKEIAEGVYGSGSQLPTEAEISERFEVNRHTVREAIRQLKEEGLVYSIRGKGTFVAREKLLYRVSKKVRFSQQILEVGHMPGTRLLEQATEPATIHVARQLELKYGDPVLALKMLRLVDGIPFSLTTSYLPADRFSGLEPHLEGSFSLYALLKSHFSIDASRQESVFEVALPEVAEMEHLQIAPTNPLLLVRSLARDQYGAAIEYCISRMRGDMGRIAITFGDEGPKTTALEGLSGGTHESD